MNKRLYHPAALLDAQSQLPIAELQVQMLAQKAKEPCLQGIACVIAILAFSCIYSKCQTIDVYLAVESVAA